MKSGAPLIAVLLLGLSACSLHYLTSERAPDASAYHVARLAIPPVVVAEDGEYRTGAVAPGGDAVVTDLLYNAVAQRTAFKTVERGDVERALAAQSPKADDTASWQRLAQAVGADAVLRGELFVYREREGSHLGVIRPASVEMELSLIAGRDGRLLWHGRYTETQQSLTEEIRTLPLYLKRGTRWLTARELAAYAIDDLIGALPAAST